MSISKEKYIKYKKKYIKLKNKMKGGSQTQLASVIEQSVIEQSKKSAEEDKKFRQRIAKGIEASKKLAEDKKYRQFAKEIKESKKTEQQKTSFFTTIFNGLRNIGSEIAKNLIGQPKKNVEDIKTIKDTLPTQMTNNWNEYDEKALQNLINHKEKLKKAIDKSEVIGFNGLQYFVMTNVVFDSKIIIDSPFPTDGKQKEASNLKEALILLGFEIAGKDDGNIKILTQFHGLDSVHRKVKGITGHGGINHEFLLSVFHNLVNGLKKVDNGILVNREEIQKLLGK